MTSRIFSSCSLFIILTLFSCGKEDKTDDIEYNIDAEFIISLKEELNPESNHLQFHTETILNTYCPGTEIIVRNESNTSANEIHLDIQNIRENSECVSKDHTATSHVTIKSLSNGTYNFKINLANTVPNEGKLIVSSDNYSLVLHSNNGISTGEAYLNRIPRRSIWGYVSHDNSEAASEVTENLLKSFLDSFEEHPLTNGYYGHFEIEGGNVNFPAEQTMNGISKFAFVLNGSIDNFKNHIKEFKSIHETLFNNEKIEVRFYYYNGEVF